jgi:hypothetical protein
MQKSCIRCNSAFSITEEDSVFYEKFKVPEPRCCPECRERRRMLFHAERRIYRRQCALSGESLLSHFHPDGPITVYKPALWWGDSWDALEYGQEIDLTRPFFPQFKTLLHRVPYSALFTDYLNNENSEYTNYAGSLKDCYLIAHADGCRDCLYGYGVKQCTSCIDIYNTVHCELCYECLDCYSCYNVLYAESCLNCSNSYFLKDCIGCKYCFGCINIRQKEYCIYNRFVGKQAFESFLASSQLDSAKNISTQRRQADAFFRSQPQRALHMLRVENSFGDQLINCKNVQHCFEISDTQDARYCTQLKLGAKDCMDVHQFGTGAELLYECAIGGLNAFFTRFCSGCYGNVSNLTYCSGCSTSKNLFGCVNLRRKEFCILNRQYAKDEYEALCTQLEQHMQRTGEWGEFFPENLSPFCYNETRAIEFFPLSKHEAIAGGYAWREDEPIKPFEAFEPPDRLLQVDATIGQKILRCEVSQRPFRITSAELRLYRALGAPLPRRSPEQRYWDRQARKKPRKLWQRACSDCRAEMWTSVPAEQGLRVVCESCYEQVLQ